MVAMPQLIRETPPPEATHTKHDQLYKELINTFFKEFLEIFFPDIHENIDFDKISPLSEEVYTDVLGGDVRKLDIVIETRLKKEDVVIIVHIEPQSYRQTDFNERMYHYFSLLYNKYRKPIIPIAIFSHDDLWEESQFTIGFDFFDVLRFNYRTLHLQKMNWRDYIHSDNPVAAALMSEMGYKKEERIQVKKEFFMMLARMQLDPAKQRIIHGFFEQYLRLTNEEEEQLMEEIKKNPEAEKIFEIPISYEEKGKEIGKEIGKELGKKEVVIEMLKEGSDLNFISKVTQFDIDEIKEIKQQL